MTALAPTARPVDAAALPRLLPPSGRSAPTPVSLAEHLERMGPLPRSGPALVGAVTAAGLRGRGGAAFPTGRKMASLGTSPARARVLVANGTEGEPLSRKDRTLLAVNPHLVLDGIAAAAGAIGADRAVLCVARGRPDLVRTLLSALDQRADPITVQLAETPDRYVAGQEHALVRWLNGGDARPTIGPRPSVRGVDGLPTLVDNVETLANIGLIARWGPDRYRSVGTDAEPGSVLLTVSGGVGRPGVHEIPFGLPAASLLRHLGAEPASAVLVGGYFGTWLAPSHFASASLSEAGLAPSGARLGCGVVVVVPAASCPLEEVAAVAEWYAANSAGQCGACLHGLADIADAVRGVVDGDAASLDAARRWTAMVRDRGACRFPDGAAGFVDSALDALAGEVDDHRRGGCGRPYGAHLPTPEGGAWR